MEISEESVPKRAKNKNSYGLLMAGITGGVVAGLYLVAGPFITPALRRFCLPFVPATPNQIGNVLRMLRGRSGNLVDLGSGDGRVVVAAARAGFTPVVGVELNPWLVLWSRLSSYRHGVSSLVCYQRVNLWKVDLSMYNNIVIFGVEQMMPALEEKLTSELSPDATVVACRFPFPRWQPVDSVDAGIDSVWLYTSNSKPVSKPPS